METLPGESSSTWASRSYRGECEHGGDADQVGSHYHCSSETTRRCRFWTARSARGFPPRHFPAGKPPWRCRGARSGRARLSTFVRYQGEQGRYFGFRGLVMGIDYEPHRKTPCLTAEMFGPTVGRFGVRPRDTQLWIRNRARLHDLRRGKLKIRAAAKVHRDGWDRSSGPRVRIFAVGHSHHQPR